MQFMLNRIYESKEANIA